LKLLAAEAVEGLAFGYFRGIRPGLIEAITKQWQKSNFIAVFPGHPPRPH